MAGFGKKQIHLAVAFCVYWMIVIYFVFFGMRTVSDLAADANLREFSNFIPFATIVGYIVSLCEHTVDLWTVLRNLLGNVIMAIPLGILLPALFQRMRWISATVITTVSVTFVLEFFQLIWKLGSFDVDCLLLRGAGAAVGFILWRMLDRKNNKEKTSADG